jgi:pimeloyl-ACP methyl ester carboxylesterase
MSIEKVKSADGTSIAFERTGKGIPLVLVGGAFCDRTARSSGTPLAALLAHRFTVFSWDRRGRRDSGDTPPWSIDRELEDLSAILAAAGGSAFVFGNSSGGLLALDAAARGHAIPKLAMYEPPVILDPGRAKGFEAIAKELEDATAADRRGDAAEIFLTKVMQVPTVAQMRKAPMWPGLEAIANTLSYDVRITARGPARLDEAASVRAPTLTLDGSASPPWMRDSLRTLSSKLPNARHRTLEGQTHDVDITVLARALEEFFGE